MILDIIIYVCRGFLTGLFFILPTWKPIPDSIWVALSDYGNSAFGMLYNLGIPINDIFLIIKYSLSILIMIIIPWNIAKWSIALIRGNNSTSV